MRMGPHSAWPRARARSSRLPACWRRCSPTPPAQRRGPPPPAPPPRSASGDGADRPLLDAGADARRRRRSTRPRGAAARPRSPASPRSPNRPSPPFAVNGRLFVRQGKQRGFCSATAIDTPSRRLVLTAGHCVNSGPAAAQRPQRLVELPRVRPRLQRRHGAVRRLHRPPQIGLRAQAVGQVRQPQLRHRRDRHHAQRRRRQRRRRGRRRRHDRHRPQPPAGLPDLRLPGRNALDAGLQLTLRRRRRPHLPDPRPADDRDPLPLGARAPAAAAG